MSLPIPRPWPVPMWPEFWPWAAWKLAGSPLPRPPESLRLAARYHAKTGRYGVPPWAWVRLSYMRARPIVPVPIERSAPAPFNGRGMFLLEPTGGTEDIGALKAAGFTYALLNVSASHGGYWEDLVIPRCRTYGIEVVPWQRVYDEQDSHELELVAGRWQTRAAAHNLEAEAVTTYTPAELGGVVDRHPARVRAVITEPWAQNGAGWAELGRRGFVMMPEAFLNARPIWDPRVVCEHAKTEAGGAPAVPAFGWGVWSDAADYVSPAEYLRRWSGPFTVYHGDGKEHRYSEWRS